MERLLDLLRRSPCAEEAVPCEPDDRCAACLAREWVQEPMSIQELADADRAAYEDLVSEVRDLREALEFARDERDSLRLKGAKLFNAGEAYRASPDPNKTADQLALVWDLAADLWCGIRR